MGKHAQRVPFKEVVKQLKQQKEEQVQPMTTSNTTNGVSASTVAAPVAVPGGLSAEQTEEMFKRYASLEDQVQALTKALAASQQAAPAAIAPTPVAAPAPAGGIDYNAMAAAFAAAFAAQKAAAPAAAPAPKSAAGFKTIAGTETQAKVFEAAQAVVETNTVDAVERTAKVVAVYANTARLLAEVEIEQNKAVRSAWPWFMRALVPVL
jgi:hypothetical protein